MAFTRTTTLDMLFTNNWWERRKRIEDVIFQKIAIFYLMTKKANMVPQTGGTMIECPVEYDTNPTVAAVGRGDQVALADVDIDTVAKYEWAYLAGSVTRYWTDEQKNQGKYAIKNMVTRKMDNLEKSMRKHAAEKLFTAQAGKEAMSIVDYIPNDPTASASIGGINQSTYSWWRNYYRDLSARPIATYLRDDMETAWNTIELVGQDAETLPDAIVTTQTVYEAYAKWGFDLIVAKMDDKKLIDLAVGDLTFKGRPVIKDTNCPSGKMFFLSFSSLNLVYDPTNWFAMTDWKSIPDQLDKVAQVIAAYQLVCANRANQGVLFGMV
jgi:hypothetical protein